MITFLKLLLSNILPKNNDTLIPLLREKKVEYCRIIRTTSIFSKQVFIKNNFKNVGIVHAGIPEYVVNLKYVCKMTQKLVSNPKNSKKKIFKNFRRAEDDIETKFFTTVRL